jgi:hypothetical protein
MSLKQKLAAAEQLLKEAYVLIELEELEVERLRTADLDTGMARGRLCAYRESARLALQYKIALERQFAREHPQTRSAEASPIVDLADPRWHRSDNRAESQVGCSTRPVEMLKRCGGKLQSSANGRRENPSA